jgi:predicted porin
MKKSLLALAVLGAFAGAASAQSSVTVYGKIDLGGVLDSGSKNLVTGADLGHSVRLSSGVSGGSRLGFKGSEDLGGGMRANFVMETGFCADSNAGAPNFCTGGNNFMGRQAYVGLSGGFGAVTLGRQYTPAFLVLTTIDPFGTGYAGQTTNLIDAMGNSQANPRWNNAAEYSTPNLGGFNATVGVGFGEQTSNWKANRAEGFNATYSGGPVYVGVGYHRINDAFGGAGKKDWIIGGVFDAKVVKIHALYDTTKNGAVITGTGGVVRQSWADASDLMFGVSVPMGQGTILASYVRHDDKTAGNADANQIGVGYNYALSKRTSLYAAAARISNKSNAIYTVGNATEAGTGNRAVNLGIVHNF